MPTNRIEGRTAVFADWAWQALIISGICTIATGVALTVWPNKSEVAMGVLAALILLGSAAAQFIVAFGAQIPTGLKVIEALSGAVALLLAIWCFDSGQWVLLLALWIGMGWMIRGVVLAIVAAWSNEYVGSGVQEGVGLATAAAGMVVAVGPFRSDTAFAVTVGLLTILVGASELVAAARVERGVAEPVSN
ncbi:DUF308 domain-containing protein [Nocardia sp. NPDC003693]